MGNPKINLGGTLTSQKYVIQNIGGALVYPTKAKENIGGTLTTIWQKNATGSGWWESNGLTASVLAQSTIKYIDYKGNTGSISNVIVDGNTVRFVCVITSTERTVAYSPPYGNGTVVYNYKFGDFSITTPTVAAGTYGNPLAGGVYTTTCSDISTTYYTDYPSTTTTTDGDNTVSVSTLNNNCALKISTSGIYCTSKTNTITVTVTLTYTHRSHELTLKSPLVTSPATALTYSNSQTGWATPYEQAGFYCYNGTVQFTISAACAIRAVCTNTTSENGSIVLQTSSGSAIATLVTKEAGKTGTVKTANVNAGTYKLQYNNMWYPSSTMLPPTVIEKTS